MSSGYGEAFASALLVPFAAAVIFLIVSVISVPWLVYELHDTSQKDKWIQEYIGKPVRWTGDKYVIVVPEKVQEVWE